MKKEQSSKPVADNGLIEQTRKELYDLFADGCGCECCKIIEKELQPIINRLSRYTPQDSLAELADRKGVVLESAGPNTGYEWYFHICNPETSTEHEIRHNKTYQEAESAARKYLQGLPDVK